MKRRHSQLTLGEKTWLGKLPKLPPALVPDWLPPLAAPGGLRFSS